MATPRIPTRDARFIDPEAERIRGRSALEALRGYAGAPSQSSAMYPGSQEAYESGELAGMAEMLIPGAAMAKGALGAALAGIIKPRGGNWLDNVVETNISEFVPRGYSGRSASDVLREMHGVYPESVIAGLSPETAATVRRSFEELVPRAAVQRWMEGPLTKYIKRDMGTPEDPVRRLAEQEISHLPYNPDPDEYGWTPDWLASSRRLAGYPEDNTATSGPARAWEEAADKSVSVLPARERYDDMTETSNQWLSKLDPETMVYNLDPDYMAEDLGVNHLRDELLNAMNPASGLPRKLQLRPEQLEQMGMEKAVRHVDAINKWRAEQKIAANQELANKALAVREYPDTPELPNPKGLRWVELGKDSPDLEKQLKYEGDVMGHCVGGYCPDVLEGKSRIFSLRDAKGEPHVTVEVNPMSKDDFINRNYADYVDMLSEGREFADRWADKSARSKFSIAQIKGKANKRPKDEYLPFVQDFVRNPPSGGQWSDIGDLGNTGLARFTGKSELAHTGGRFNIPPGLYSAAELRRMAKEAGVADDEIESLVSRYKFAEGGAVRAPAGNWRRMDLGGTIGYLMEG